MSLSILDCTLRDGGYYNNWDFHQETVESYINALKSSKIDAVEIGFRSLPNTSYHGPYFYSTDEYLLSLGLPETLRYGVMVNAADFNFSGKELMSKVKSLFTDSKDSPISLVRVATNIEEFSKSRDLIQILKRLNYDVFLNLMQSNGKPRNKMDEISSEIKSWNLVDVLYFADSLGSMTPKEVADICNVLSKEWEGKFGIHTHDNKGLALANSMRAVEEGVSWCDSTILGMGRGAGNVSTESLVMECKKMNYHDADPSIVAACAKTFLPLKQKYNWGPNPYYHFAANHSIHPSYVQSLLSDKRYNSSTYFQILETISKSSASSYNEENLRRAVYCEYEQPSKGTWDASGWLKGRDVLLVGSGPILKKHLKGILSYINKNKPFVLTLNVNRHLPQNLVDAVIVSHYQRSILDFVDYGNLGCPIIMPKDRLLKKSGNSCEKLNILDYGLNIMENAFSIGRYECTIPSPNALCYALAFSTQAQAKAMYLVGFDGYELPDPRQEEIVKVFLKYKEHPKSLPLMALTPSSYPILQGSIYAPQLPTNDFLVVIPARYQSSRFPGKPLANLCGKSLLCHVWEKCIQAVGTENVIVATDDKRIFEHCNDEGMKVLMTSKSCLTGTDRLAEVAKKIRKKIYVNVQGDEPLINPKDIKKILKASLANPDIIFNGMCDITNKNDYNSYNVPKVVCSENKDLLYISRAPVPASKSGDFVKAKRQVCVYSYPRNSLLDFGKCNSKSYNENIEDIEILRFFELGYKIKMIEVSDNPVAVDTVDDLVRAEKILMGLQ